MKNLLYFAMVLPLMTVAQNKLSIEVSGVRTSNGNIKVAVYNSDDAFLKVDAVYTANSVQAEQGKTVIDIEDLPDGEYALAVFHDENDNDKLDTNFLGIPKEDIGFSNAKMRTFGPPRYSDCAFTLNSNKEIRVFL